MIWQYIKERLSWILFFLAMQCLLVFYSFIDPNLTVSSILYFIYLSSSIFTIFLVFRHFLETKFYKRLKERSEILDTSELADPSSPLEEIVYDEFIEQTNYYKKRSTYHQLMLEQEKDDLLSWIHEIKTPLTAMQLILDRMDNKQTQADLQYEWLRIHYLLDQQLHQKRMLVIENDLHLDNVDIKQLIHNEIRTLRSWCLHKGIGFDIQIDTHNLVTDEKWTSFILRQILSNAVKYSEHSDIEIQYYKTENHTALTVKDNGIGIPNKDIPRIFDKGFTSTATYHNDTSGATGMGLYLAKKAADSLHIRINVESEEGVGTTFTLLFPEKNTFAQLREQNASM
ncbi:OmpR family two-component system bacitracin resistance sensor histidine kinase BceS [Gracilibacillus halotolerans]|uniref:histidine kinase n=1 Tax=Gracilibacillus halotolerans TaxID=74386 RepID=A0A841RLH6_9BACI|nr:sensor histidine kinase [Gracilibacillus halotolerans]MBB6513339.1 OmpR family two-component system bacitracin resistance sensor histidine kinase BceS [Gracilibacillus halotolerans]